MNKRKIHAIISLSIGVAKVLHFRRKLCPCISTYNSVTQIEFFIFHRKHTLWTDSIPRSKLATPTEWHFCLSYEWVLLIFFHEILLMSMSSCLKPKTIPALANENDHQALLGFKIWITQDPLQIMSSWNDSVHFYN